MPHGGYHGTIAVNPGSTLAVGQGSGLTVGPDRDDKIIGGQSVLTNQGIQNVGGSAPSTTQNIEKAIEDKKLELQILDTFQGGTTKPELYEAFGTNLMAGTSTLPAGIVPGTTFPLTGATGDTAKGLATLQNIKNQELNNLLRQQQEQNLANQVKSLFAKAGSDKETADKLRPLFTGDLGDKTFLGINLGSTETTDSDKTSGLGAATVINPFTGERITTGKIREGMTSPEYAQYMSELYNLNPALMEQMFPVASGNLAQPILARLLEGGLGGVGSGIGSFIDSATGAIFKPKGGTFTPSDVSAPSDTGGVTSVIDAPKANNNPFNIPSAFTGFYESDFYNPNAAGGQMITPVTLPDGTVVRFPNTAIGGQFRQYLESLGINQPPATDVDVVRDTSQPTTISNFDVDKFYASLPKYTQSGVMAPINLSRFTDALRMFPGATV